MKVAIYGRTSTPKQNLDSQVDIAISHAERLGHEVACVFADGGVSGVITSRAGLNALLMCHRRKMFEGVVVCSWDRLTRDVDQRLELHSYFKQCGVSILSIYDAELDKELSAVLRQFLTKQGATT